MKKTTMGLLAVLIIGIVAAGASAFGGLGGLGKGSAVRDAIEANDYNAWKSAVQADLTQERFDQIAARHGQMAERRGSIMQHQAEMETALESGDFNTWKTLMEERPMGARIELSQENFNRMADMHEAMESGDTEKAQELREELGLGKGSRHGGKGVFGGDCPMQD